MSVKKLKLNIVKPINVLTGQKKTTPSAKAEGVPIPILWVMGNHGGAEGNVPQPGNYHTECAK